MSPPESNDLRNVPRLIIRGDGSFNADPKGDWVSTRHFDEALAEIERLQKLFDNAVMVSATNERLRRFLREGREALGSYECRQNERWLAELDALVPALEQVR